MLATSISVALGTSIGVSTAFYSGRFDNVVMRLVDILMAFPGILLALIVVALLGPGLTNAMIAVGIGQAPSFSRVVRGATMAVKNNLFIEAARGIGAHGFWVMWRAYPSERPARRPGIGNLRVRRRHPHWSFVELPRSRSAATDARVGEHARSGPGILEDQLVGGDPTGCRVGRNAAQYQRRR